MRLGRWIGGMTELKRIFKLVLRNYLKSELIPNKEYKTRNSNIRLQPDWPIDDMKEALTELNMESQMAKQTLRFVAVNKSLKKYFYKPSKLMLFLLI